MSKDKATNPDYPQDIPKPPREGRCKFYPKDPSGDPRKGGHWYYPDPDPKKGGEWIPQPPLDRAKIYVSDPIALDLESMENRFYRADLEIYGLEHGGASYEGRVFINNRNANQETPKTAENGYAGSFYVFGHGGCFGDPGHCDVSEHRREYDLRLSHPLTRMFTRLSVTEQIRRQIEKGAKDFIFTVVPVIKGGDPAMCDFENVFLCKQLSLVTFDK